MSSKNRIGLYAAASEVELDRLAKFGYPFTVSAGILDQLLFTSLLDAGCGVSPALGQYAIESGSGYMGVDSGVTADGRPMVDVLADRLRELDLLGVPITRQADILELKGNSWCDATHERFVLMHTPENRRADVIKRLLDIARKVSVFLEFDWTPMLNAKSPTVLMEFVEVASRFAGLTGMDLKMGASLPNYFVDCGFEIDVVTFSRPEADYTGELIWHCEVMREQCSLHGWTYLVNKVQLVQEQLQNKPIKFVPANIVAVIVRK